MVLATMRTTHLSLGILILPLSLLFLPLSLVLMVPLLVVLLMSLSPSLNLEDLVVQVLEFVCPYYRLFKGDRWHNTCGIPLDDRVKSLKEHHYFLLHGVDQFGGISRQPLELGELLLD